ncbi:hypothetical protein M9H77_13239 [Catharanthus roseus]|uniref:Uncharacterized protein n=1 Tax=Catharanthus roseus TaxID=4058 RepID=A0ACC0BJI9_CATRO|nr:hypothetical protein M9H77_13239 [Catharanthus roseus]
MTHFPYSLKKIFYINRDGQGNEELQGPTTRERARRIKENDDKVAHGLMIAIEETMKKGQKFKNKGLKDDGKIFLISFYPKWHWGAEDLLQALGYPTVSSFTMSSDGHLPTLPHHKVTSDATRINVMKPCKLFNNQLRACQNNSKVWAYDIAPPYDYYDMSAQSSYPFHVNGYQGMQATRG